MKTKIWENLSELYFEGDITKEQAVEMAVRRHNRHPNRWHEIHRYEEFFGKYIGVAQWKPGDCEHHCLASECRYCNPQSPKGEKR